MVVANDAWRASAAYLYVLGLDGPLLAWEYLRRNPDYRRDWDGQRSDPTRCAAQWGLAFLEDPQLDARGTQPVWSNDPDALVHIAAYHANAAPTVDAFGIWNMPGRKSLLYDGRQMLLAAFVGARILRMAIASDISDGAPFAYVIRSGVRARARCQAVEDYLTTLFSTEPRAYCASRQRPGRVALLHMRALQALDGRAIGASHREIAAAIFGEDRVAESWHADSELRAQVRHLLRRGAAFMRGDYRNLIAPEFR